MSNKYQFDETTIAMIGIVIITCVAIIFMDEPAPEVGIKSTCVEVSE